MVWLLERYGAEREERGRREEGGEKGGEKGGREEKSLTVPLPIQRPEKFLIPKNSESITKILRQRRE
jgi:hypothetical protein